MKICIKCDIEQSETDFEKGRNVCKTCRSKQYAANRIKNRDRRNQQSAEWRKNNPDRPAENWSSYYERNKEPLKERQKKKYRENPVKHLLYAAKQRSRNFGLAYNLSEEDLTIPEFCPILGIRIEIGLGDKYSSPSIDRVKPELGYVKGNVAIMSLRANQIKGTATLAELKSLVNFFGTV
jgi:hypothetical protein